MMDQVFQVERWFELIESSLPLLLQRYTTISWSVLQQAVETCTREPFPLHGFGQVMRIYPQGYKVTHRIASDELFIEPLDRAGKDAAQRKKEFMANLDKFINCAERDVNGRVVTEIVPMEMPKNGASFPEGVGNKHINLNVNNDGSNNNELMMMLKKQAAQGFMVRGGKNTPVLVKRKFMMMDSSSLKENDVNQSNYKKRLKGLPKKLIEKVHAQHRLEQLMQPEAILHRQRSQARASLPSFFDMIYLHFRTLRHSRVEFEELVRCIVEKRGPNSYGPGVSSRSCKLQLVREQLMMLIDILPEWCNICESKITPGKQLFNVNLSPDINLSALRKKTMLTSM